MLTDTFRNRLRSQANDCKQRAARSDCLPEARGLYHEAARKAEQFAAMRAIGAEGLRLAIHSVEADMSVAAWMNGEGVPESATSPLSANAAREAPLSPPDGFSAPSESPEPPAEALNARQLADRFDMTDRGARKAMSNAYYRGEPGFYCEPHGQRSRWLAEPDAFKRVARRSSV